MRFVLIVYALFTVGIKILKIVFLTTRDTWRKELDSLENTKYHKSITL